jgi:hydroxymethylglutaryl-CoA reductase
MQQPELTNVWQMQVSFKTADSMGANFINTCLEAMKEPLINYFAEQKLPAPEIIMGILSNYTPNCLVSCEVSCKVEQLAPYAVGLSPQEFAQRFQLAMDIAYHNTHRAVTHNKGIYNGIDAVVLATGNDFRAVEAAGHAYASRDGQYRSLSKCEITKEGEFKLSLTLPLALGTVGGLTRLHPLAALSMEILQNPSAEELMSIVASAGLANNFAAVASLVTTGIQKGHMKLHLSNILTGFNATPEERERTEAYFSDKTVSIQKVREFLKR